MIAVQMMSGNPLLGRPKRSAAVVEHQPERAGISTAGGAAADSAPFQPLDSSIVSDAIPAFFIGRNGQGFWVAREATGRIGGVFLLETSALSFARMHSHPTGCATIFQSDRFELDLENSGNPLVPHLGSLMRLAIRAWRRTTGPLGNFTEAIKRRSDGYRYNHADAHWCPLQTSCPEGETRPVRRTRTSR